MEWWSLLATVGPHGRPTGTGYQMDQEHGKTQGKLKPSSRLVFMAGGGGLRGRDVRREEEECKEGWRRGVRRKGGEVIKRRGCKEGGRGV